MIYDVRRKLALALLRRGLNLREVAELFGMEARVLHRELEDVSRETLKQEERLQKVKTPHAPNT